MEYPCLLCACVLQMHQMGAALPPPPPVQGTEAECKRALVLYALAYATSTLRCMGSGTLSTLDDEADRLAQFGFCLLASTATMAMESQGVCRSSTLNSVTCKELALHAHDGASQVTNPLLPSALPSVGDRCGAGPVHGIGHGLGPFVPRPAG